MPNQANPFKPGAGRQPPYLAGRDDELGEFAEMLQRVTEGQAENMLMHGLRGVGKTVLLGKFAEICRDSGFLPVTELQYGRTHSESAEFFKTFMYDFDSALDGDFSVAEKAKKKAGRVAKYIKPAKVGVGEFSFEPSYAMDDSTPLMHKLIDHMKKRWNVVKGGDYKGVVFLLDEFHAVNGRNGQNTLESFIGAMNQLQNQEYGYWLVLCGLPALKNNVKAARSYSERMFTAVEISNLDHDSAKKAICRPLEDVPWNFSPELVTAIIEDTDRYPYFIQFYSKEIIELTGKKDVRLEDYASVRDAITAKLERSFFDQRIESLNRAQKEILHTIAKIPGTEMAFGTIVEMVGKDKRAMSMHLKRLEEKGAIYKHDRGVYRFTLPLFKEYLLKGD